MIGRHSLPRIEKLPDQGRWKKFVPASGAASRMFALKSREDQKRFCHSIDRFAFAEQLKHQLRQKGIELERLIQCGESWRSHSGNRLAEWTRLWADSKGASGIPFLLRLTSHGIRGAPFRNHRLSRYLQRRHAGSFHSKCGQSRTNSSPSLIDLGRR